MGPSLSFTEGDKPGKDNITNAIVDGWIADATRYAVVADQKLSISKRLARLKDRGDAERDEQEIAEFWTHVHYQSPASAYEQKVADLACASFKTGVLDLFEYAPYVARGLLHNGILAARDHGLPAIAARMRSGRQEIADCPGVEGFTDKDWADLDKLWPPPK